MSSALAAIGLSAAVVSAQQPSRGPTPLSRAPSPLSRNVLPEAPPSDTSIDPMLASKATRYLLRNGMDYLAYREYARALSFFRAVEARQSELSPADLDTLKKGIAKAQQGMREAVNTTRVVSQPVKGRPGVQPGALALAQPPTADPVQLASAELPSPPPMTPSPAPVATAPAPAPPAIEAEPAGLPTIPARMATSAPPSEPTPDRSSPAPTLAPEPSRVEAPAPAPVPAQEAPEVVPAGLPASAPPPIGLEAPGASAPLPAPASSSVELPPAGQPPMPAEPGPAPSPAPVPVEVPASVAETPASASASTIELPPVAPASASTVELPVPGRLEPIPASAIPPRLALASERIDASPPVPMPAEPAASSSTPEPPPAAEAAPLPPLPGEPRRASAMAQDVAEPILSPRLRREVEELAQAPRGTDRPGAGAGPETPDPNSGSMPSQGSTRLELQRAPSPTEARPIRKIPVPEEYVPLGAREWNPGRKYWAAAGTCHMTLYFQDPVLERYGQGVEQALGPRGRYFSYPLDDPRQSNQRNQILQPFYSIGKFCFQVGTLPYKMLMDPPWEAEYDLGYYRPGDPIPPDTVYVTPTGVGPPLKGRHY